jgi:predicted transcriptional regulator
MRASSLLRDARREAGLTQRELARRAGMPQPTVARIEGGRVDPRAETLGRLLAACGKELGFAEVAVGMDRSAIRELLLLSPAERARLAVQEARNLQEILARR